MTRLSICLLMFAVACGDIESSSDDLIYPEDGSLFDNDDETVNTNEIGSKQFQDNNTACSYLEVAGEGRYDGSNEPMDYNSRWSKSNIRFALTRGTLDLPEDSLERRTLTLALMVWYIEVPLQLTTTSAINDYDVDVHFADSSEYKKFATEANTLADATLPNEFSNDGSRIIFNEDHAWSPLGRAIASNNQRAWPLLHVMIHEIGHILGLTHVQHVSLSDSVMYPNANGNTQLTEHDIKQIRAKYGTRRWNSREEYEAAKELLNSWIENLGS